MPKNIEKAYALSDAKIQFVSLVDKAANKRQFLITKAEEGSATFQSYGRIVKADSESHFVTGIVYEPMAEDTDGEYMTAEEIEKAAHWYMKNTGEVDIQHCFVKAKGIDVVESFVAKSDMEIDGTPIKKGTWLMTVEVGDSAVWESIQKGEITGFSMGGVATRSDEDVNLDEVEKSATAMEGVLEVTEPSDSFFKKLTKAIKEAFKSDKTDETTEQVTKGAMAESFARRTKESNLYTAWRCLEDTLEGYQPDPETGEWKWGYTADEEKIKEALEDFNAIVTKLLTSDDIIGEIEKAAKEAPVDKAGKSLSSKNLNALKTICGNLQSFLAEFDTEGTDDGAEDGGDGADGAGVSKSKTLTKEDESEMKKSEVEAVAAEVIKSALEPVIQSIEDLKKSEDKATDPQEVTKNDGDGDDAEDSDDSISEDVVKSIVKDALAEALAPVTQQLDAIKKSRALPSNLNDGPDSVKKSEEVHYLHGIL